MTVLEASRGELHYVATMAQLSFAAYKDGYATSEWSYVDPTTLGIAKEYTQGRFFSDGVAQAAVLMNAAGDITISFRGTEILSRDIISDIGLSFSDAYWQHFKGLIKAAKSAYPTAHLNFTGHSLGGAAVHQLAAFANSHPGYLPPGTEFFSFSSPKFYATDNVRSVGFANDTIYGVLDSLLNADVDQLYFANTPNGTILTLKNVDAHYIQNTLDALHRIDRTYVFGELIDLSHPIIINALSSYRIPDSFSDTVYLIGKDTPVYQHEDEGVDDRLIGRDGPGRDWMDGMRGNDVIDGRGGNDVLYGQEGRDRIDGGSGNDQVYGGDGIDTLTGGLGNDRLKGQNGNDTVDGGDGRDFLTGGSGDDILQGGDDGDTLMGGTGTNKIYGGAGWDTYFMFSSSEDTIIDAVNSTYVFSSYSVDTRDTDSIYFAYYGIDGYRINYTNDTATKFVIDETLRKQFLHFDSIDDTMKTYVDINMSGEMWRDSGYIEDGYTGGLRCIVGDGGSVVNVNYLSPPTTTEDWFMAIDCGAGEDKITIDPDILRAAFAARYDAQDGIVNREILIDHFSRGVDRLAIAQPWSRDDETFWDQSAGTVFNGGTVGHKGADGIFYSVEEVADTTAPGGTPTAQLYVYYERTHYSETDILGHTHTYYSYKPFFEIYLFDSVI